MRRGYELNEFSLFYQPQYEMASGKIKGAEALIRWHHATKGYISPIEFISVAEDTGFINTLGQFVIERACQQAKLWIELGYPIVIAVNVSAVQFANNNNLLEQILSSLERSGLPPNYLELELTESTLALQPDKLMQIMNQLRSCGVRFSVDDFGTGYSNLSYLKSFPLDKIKIDQSFVRDIPGDSHDEGLIKSIISLAASLELNCIAEGVETSDQVNFLISLGCEEAQGYFFARPLPSVELTELLTRYKSML
nr:EAL domain-containing protein [Methylocucumis oryzae]